MSQKSNQEGILPIDFISYPMRRGGGGGGAYLFFFIYFSLYIYNFKKRPQTKDNGWIPWWYFIFQLLVEMWFIMITKLG